MTTLLKLKNRARQLSDMEESTFVSDGELTGYINQSSLELYDLLVAVYEDYYITESSELVVASGVSTIALPVDFYKLRGVDYKKSGSDWVDIKPFAFQDRNSVANSGIQYGNSLGGTGVQYRLQGSVLKLSPVDSASGTYRIWYVPKLTLMVIDTDSLPTNLDPWDEYVAVDAAIKMAAKEESSTSSLEKMKKALTDRIQTMARARDAAHPEVILPSTRSDFWWYSR